jgi:hypothetical protein
MSPKNDKLMIVIEVDEKVIENQVYLNLYHYHVNQYLNELMEI